MSVDYLAITIALDGIFLAVTAVQFVFCTFLLIRSGKSLPSRSAIFVLLGGLTVQLAEYATTLSEDSNRVGNYRTLNGETYIYRLIEGTLTAFRYFIVLSSFLVMLKQSGQGTKNEQRVKKVALGGGCILFATLGLQMGHVANHFVSDHRILYGEAFRADEVLAGETFKRHGLMVPIFLLNIAFIVVLALGGLSNTVHHLRKAIFCGLIPATLVQLALSAVLMGFDFAEAHLILANPAYLYPTRTLTLATDAIIPACLLYVGYGWKATDHSYVLPASMMEVGKKSVDTDSVDSKSVEIKK